MVNEQNSPKKQFRERCLKRLGYASKRNSYVKDKSVVDQLKRVIRQDNAYHIMLYIPLGIEVNIDPLIRWLRRQRRAVYVPFMEGASFRLVKYRYPLKKKRFGIKEPNSSKQYRNKQIDLAVVPIVGMDAAHRRVGFGKGMYDRFFEKEAENIKKVVFVARELCYSNKIITDHYDVKADIVIVP